MVGVVSSGVVVLKIIRDMIAGFPALRVSGQLDRLDVSTLEQVVLADLSAGHRCLLVDMGACSFMRNSVVAVMLSMARTILDGRILAVVAPLDLRLLFDTAGLAGTEGFRVFGDRAAADAYLSAS